MSSSLEAPADKAGISAARNAWREAVAAGDADRLADLITHDVVVVHADGRCTRGRDDVRRFFIEAFDRYDLEGKIFSSEIVVHGIWAVEIDEIQLKRTQYGSPISTDAALQAVFVYSHQLDNAWKVSRLIELPA